MNAPELSLAGRVAIVSGAARGLGRAHALELARRGARLVLLDVLDGADVAAEIEAAGGEASFLTLDLAQLEAAPRVLETALEAFGRVDGLVNNAGLIRDRMSFNLSAAEWELVLTVNLSASFLLSQALVRHWRQLGSGGAIVNTSSESGLYGNVGQANYAAAKAGVAAMTITMASELARSSIRVNAIAPRARTPMSDQAFGALPREERFDPFAPEHVSRGRRLAALRCCSRGDRPGPRRTRRRHRGDADLVRAAANRASRGLERGRAPRTPRAPVPRRAHSAARGTGRLVLRCI